MTESLEAPSRQSGVTLREVDAGSVLAICELSVRENQRKFVNSNAESIAHAHFSEVAWFRAIYADQTPVGFIMLADRPKIPEYFLWRFMIDARYQGMGFGRHAIALLIEYVKTRPNVVELLTSCLQGEGSPQGFYESLGFELTGKVDEGEAVLRLRI